MERSERDDCYIDLIPVSIVNFVVYFFRVNGYIFKQRDYLKISIYDCFRVSVVVDCLKDNSG